MRFSSGTRGHSFLAAGSSHAGHLGKCGFGLGSNWFSGRFPGLPLSTLSAVGFGGLPRMVISITYQSFIPTIKPPVPWVVLTRPYI
jgi:hypothetical protein